ncbi:hypothetical protein OGW18_18130 [Citrobacter sp. CK184]|uniref:hypothetical protein n=1 Tax=Citrobacter TaxID=544 RepID=UPI001904706F|nr:MULTISPECIES: hypothetical protein [Citrobacter]EKV5612148.1 hypothetical protein [Citrobacter koseri]MBJ9245475.1 hypothetical protein [Citrobacter koseri]MDM3031574.1 hypothetical protein [Citrobacter sp. CK185]MDM3048214.1 hypothetical protein [Citrobacter sp. CK184]HCT3157487.1 hypothetical protein [Citrobacter koseri]
MRQQEEEILWLKKLVTNLRLDKTMLQGVLAKRPGAGTASLMELGAAGMLRGQRTEGLFCASD